MAGLLLALPITWPATGSAAPARDWAARPFADDSIWNRRLDRRVDFETSADPRTAALRDENVGGAAHSIPWLANPGIGVYRASPDDPIATWSYDSRADTAAWPAGPAPFLRGKVRIPTPAAIRFGGGTDRLAIILLPDGRSAYELWLGEQRAKGAYHAPYLVRTDLTGSGIARPGHVSEGIRAFGGSLIGGLVRCRELDALDIPHGIAVTLSTTELRAAPTMAGQTTWPATHSDGSGHNGYAGLIPMGALIGIPPDVDVTRLGLSPEGVALARAYQLYGGYVVDQADRTNVLVAMEAGCDQAALARLQQDRKAIARHLAVAAANPFAPRSTGGAADGASR